MTEEGQKSKIQGESSCISLCGEVEKQLGEINVPNEHLELLKHLVVLSRQDARTQFGSDFVERTREAFANPEKGAICLVPDFRFDLAHEIGHLVWHSVLTDMDKKSFEELSDERENEFCAFSQKLIARFGPKLFDAIDPRSEESEEGFSWAYSFYLLLDRDSELFPAIHQWMRERVFGG